MIGTYSVGLEPTSVRERLPVNSLGLDGAVEEDVGHAHDVVVDNSATSDQVDQPAEHLVGGTADLQERQAGEAHNNAEAPERNTVLGTITEDLGSAALEGKTVQAAGGTVGVGVASTEDRGDHEGVDDVRQDVDSKVGHGNDIRRGSSGLRASILLLTQSAVVVGKDDASAKSTEDEEKTETPVDGLESVLDVDARALGFSGDHGDVLRTDDTEGGAPETRKETFESTESAIGKVCRKGAGRIPVSEAVGIALRVSADHGDEGEAEENEDQDDLASRQPELSFTVSFDGENVEGAS